MPNTFVNQLDRSPPTAKDELLANGMGKKSHPRANGSGGFFNGAQRARYREVAMTRRHAWFNFP
ncbi:hypothetical protein [Numidum massiliense]|uniref:hypothetical protein n=1 Tax=Numidum massiliense TaxID=1522315 RepID=UPI00164D22C1|nr:hypothetical protein [Numidum massiliense]